MWSIRRTVILAMGTVLLGASAHAEVSPELIAAAKAEGEVVWYTGFVVRQVVNPLKEAFEKKYGVTLNFAPFGSQEMAIRILNEGRVGAVKADVFDGTEVYNAAVKAGLILPYRPAEAKVYPDQLKEPNGLWTAVIQQVMSPAINTDLVSPEDAPKSFEDLLDPKWKGQMAWSNAEAGAGPPGFIGNVLIGMGEKNGMEYLRKLAKQDIANIPSNQRVVLDQCISGQYPLVLQIFNYHAAISAGQGAPVRWLKLEFSMFAFNTIQLLKDSPHPNAGKLFVEYLLSEEGQKVVRDAGYIPAHPGVAALSPELKPQAKGLAGNLISGETFEKNKEKWIGIYRELFR